MENINNTGSTTDLSTITIIPKRPNWDLKRDLNTKLSILDKRTNQAIQEILRDKLKHNNTSNNTSSSATTIATPSTTSTGLEEQYTGPMDTATLARLVSQQHDEETTTGESHNQQPLPRRRYDDDDD